MRNTWDHVEPAAAPVASGGAWIVRMKRDGVREVIEAVARGDCRIFWTIDVPPGSSLADVKRAFAEGDPDLGSNRLANHAGQVHRFITKMQRGDRVLAPDGAELYIGTIDSDARRENDEWVRTVVWGNGAEPVGRETVSPALYSRLRTLLTITDISDLTGELDRLMEAADDPVDAVRDASAPRYAASLRRMDTDTAQGLLLDPDWLQGIVDLLQRKRQLVFFGPPGTGKTWLAERLAEYLVGDPSHCRIVQFHPSYAYEDFVQGYRPTVDAKGRMSYELKPGPLVQLADEARANPGEPYVLVVDEINRGNLAKIFGELYYLLEYRERSIVLQYGGGVDDEFSLPANLYVIGTMNTADRSIALVDAAIRCRFGFVEFSPLEPPVGSVLRAWLRRERRDDRPARLLDELNARLGERDLAIGPSYLMTSESADEAGLARVDDARSALAAVMIWHATRALRPTPLQGYRTEEASARHLRGRVLFERQIASRAGVALPVELRFDEYDVDIVENRVLLAALRRIEPLVAEAPLARVLGHLRRTLDGVTPWTSGRPVPEIPWTRLNGRYRAAASFARLVLDGGSLELVGEAMHGRGFLIDTPRVFEAYLAAALTAALSRFGGEVRAHHATALDERGEIRMVPDITWWRDGRCRAVIDAKYKRVRSSNHPNADAYQMLAYCTRLGLDEGWLVYADLDGGTPTSRVVRNAGVTIRVTSIDLAGSIEGLRASVEALADRLGKG